MKTRRIPFIVFEGSAGSGLSTQAFEAKSKLEINTILFGHETRAKI